MVRIDWWKFSQEMRSAIEAVVGRGDLNTGAMNEGTKVEYGGWNCGFMWLCNKSLSYRNARGRGTERPRGRYII